MRLTLNENIKYQKFEGFGASGAWWAQCVGQWESRCENGLQSRDEIMRLLYDKEYGIGLRTYRYNIGAGSAETGRGDIPRSSRRTECFEISGGKYDFSKDSAAVYMMKKAVEYGAQEVVFFVNSPLERLTKNNKSHLDKHSFFRTNLPKENIPQFVKYCLDVTEHFVSQGLPIKYLSPINEPVWVWNGGQEGCHYKPSQCSRILLAFADEMEKRNSLVGLKLSGLENGDVRYFNKSYTRSLMKHDKVRKRIDSIDIHSYCKFVPLPFLNDRTAFTKRYKKWLDKKYPGMPVKMSEWCHMERGIDTTMNSALETARIIYEDISILNVTSWQHWIACALTSYNYCDGLIYVDEEKETFEITKRYYVTGNFSKFIAFGAHRFEVTSDDKTVMTLGFIKDNIRTIIIINPTESEKSLSFPSSSDIYVTDDNSDLKHTAYEKNEIITLTPRSVTTVVLTEEQNGR